MKKKYFQILEGGQNRVFILRDNTRFDTRTGVPSNCFKIWKDGTSKYVTLLPDAKELLLKEKITDLVAYVNRSVLIQDIEVLASVFPKSTTLQEAAKKRKEQLTNKS